MNQTDDLSRSTRSSRLVLRLSRHWLKIALGFLFLYVGLALLAPVLLHAGYDGAANVLYKMYGPMCHQFAFRSWFFYGDQLVYPRTVSGTDLQTFEQYASSDAYFENVDLYSWSADLQIKARSFRGNEEMGYKTALCERDVIIYATMFLAGLLFSRVRNWLRPAPIWLYLILGLAPMGLDGFSQMFSYPPFEFWPVRETLPGYRVLTGALFGLMNIWLAFPYLESSMRDTIKALEDRFAVVEKHPS